MRTSILLLVVVLAGGPAAADYPARVVGVSDGDTLTVLTADRSPVKVRLYGIDAPETRQDFGSRAKQAASELAFDQEVTVRPLEKDRYGRTVAEVILPDGRSLGQELVRRGMAWWYRKYAPADLELTRLESEAKTGRLGLWSQPGAVPPWDWRKGDGAPRTSANAANRRTRADRRPAVPGAPRPIAQSGGAGLGGRNRVSTAGD